MKNKSFLQKISLGILAAGICLSATAQKKYKLQLNPENGSVYSIPMTMKSTITQMGMDIIMNMDMTSQYAFKNKGADKEIAFTYKHFRMDMDAMGQKVVLNSDSTGSINEPFQKLKNKTISCTITKEGKVLNIVGADSLSKLLGDNPASSMLGDDAVRSSIQQSFNIYPKEPVAIGQSWNTSYLFKSGIELKCNNTYTLEKVEKDVAFIKIHSVISSDSAQKINQNGIDMEMSINGNNDGSMELDIKTGLFKTSTLTQDLDGKVNAMGQDIPIKIKNDIQISSAKL